VNISALPAASPGQRWENLGAIGSVTRRTNIALEHLLSKKKRREKKRKNVTKPQDSSALVFSLSAHRNDIQK
jgi:hypothetical protein